MAWFRLTPDASPLELPSSEPRLGADMGLAALPRPELLSSLSRFAGWLILLVIPSATTFTWVFNNTQGSLLAAILFRMSLDVAEWVVPLGLYEGNAARFAISAVVNWALAYVLVIAFGAECLAKPRPEANS